MQASESLRVALTGGIACGKSLVARYLGEAGLATIDADDIVHELIPDPAERRRLAAEVFADPEKRRELEARIHPLVRERINRAIEQSDHLTIAIIPLLFETRWDAEYDIICCVTSERETQISRMVATRGYTRAEAEARLMAQLPVAEKAAKSHYVIHNDGSPEELKRATERFVQWLKKSTCLQAP